MTSKINLIMSHIYYKLQAVIYLLNNIKYFITKITYCANGNSSSIFK